MTSAARLRVAVDVGGAHLSAADVVEAVRSLTTGRPELSLVLVGDPAAFEATPVPPGVEVVAAPDSIGDDDDPARAVRARRGASVRVATRLLRVGAADAVVSFGPAAATLAAAQFSLGRVPGMTQVCLAAELPSEGRPAVLVDAGAGPAAAPETLIQYAYAGAVYARTQLGAASPFVGLLSAGFRTGSGDPSYDEADRRLHEVSSSPAAPFGYAGPVPVDAVWAGASPADVVITAGFAGALLIDAVTRVVGASQAGAGAASTHSEQMSATAAATAAPPARSPARSMVVLGVNGVVVTSVVPAATGSAVAQLVAGITRAADAAMLGLVPALTEEMARLLARRRASAGALSALPVEAGR